MDADILMIVYMIKVQDASVRLDQIQILLIRKLVKDVDDDPT